MDVKEIIRNISEEWFLKEPAFYSLYCLQDLQPNERMECGVRVGEGRIEYNPLVLAKKNYKEIELLLRIEMIRLFLKHPYERRPEGCCGEAIALGSDCTIADGYCLLKEAGALKGPGAYHLPIGQCYEWYCKEIQRKDENQNDDSQSSENQHSTSQNQGGGNNSSSSLSNPADRNRSELWHDDSLRQTQINALIERTTDWGSLSGDIVEQIKASTQARLNSSMVFQGFKSNLMSAHRQLTRMRPNRRTGFLQMGSRRTVQAHLLIAIDCSGSIDSETLSRFFAIINRLFRDGNMQLSILQFDAQVLSVSTVDRTMPQVEVLGRGGTDYQPVIDYWMDAHRQYDGLMILTDGQAPAPHLPSHHAPILWVCRDETAYDNHHKWMEIVGRCCWV